MTVLYHCNYVTSSSNTKNVCTNNSSTEDNERHKMKKIGLRVIYFYSWLKAEKKITTEEGGEVRKRKRKQHGE